jgi:dienelactone hydrolase
VPGLYGGAHDAVATVSLATEAMAAASKSYEPIIYEGETVFLKAQEGLDANRRATEDAWPRTLAVLREHLEG